MRLKRNELRTVYIKKRVLKNDAEGGQIESFVNAGKAKVQVWPAGGKVQAAMYGERLNYIQNILIDGLYKMVEENGAYRYKMKSGTSFCENDAICLYVPEKAEPDYRIISVKPYQHLQLEVEKIVGRRTQGCYGSIR